MNGFVSPSVKTTTSRLRAVGEKKLSVAMRATDPRVVIRTLNPSVGGGRSIPITLCTVTSNVSESGVGNRCGSARSVIDAMPTGMSVSSLRRRIASACARSNLVGEPTPADAFIDSDVSSTNHASASVRMRWCERVTSVGCVAARPNDAATIATATAGASRAPRDGSTKRRSAATRLRPRSATRNATIGTTTRSVTNAPNGVRNDI